MKVKIESYIGYSRYFLEIGGKEAAELFVFLIDHSSKKDPHYILEDFKILNGASYEDGLNYGNLLLQKMRKEESKKPEIERINWVKLGSSFQKIGEAKKLLNKDVSSKGALNLKDFIYEDDPF